MGFFSFNTADTQQSIANKHSKIGAKTVYLLQPHNQIAIEENEYDGYGNFGNINAYNWLANTNYPDECNDLTEEEVYLLGVTIKYGAAITDEQGNYYFCHLHTTKKLVKILFKNAKNIVEFNNFESLIDVNGTTMSINQAIEQKKLKRIAIKYDYPLKFSFNKKAIYEDLPESTDCEFQGYFY
jgi:hypothetical protein